MLWMTMNMILTFHVVIENQLQAKDPIEVLHFYHTMRKKKLSHHDTIHLIGSIMVPFIFYSLKQQREFDTESYKHLLRKYQYKKPDKIPAALEKDIDNIFHE